MQLTPRQTFALSLAVAALLLPAIPATGQVVPRAEYMVEGSFQLPPEGQAGGIDRPVALAMAPDRSVHVADGRGMVLVYDSSGVFQKSYGSSQLDEPRSIVVGSEGVAYVLDSDRKQILVYGPGGEPIRAISERGSRGGQLSDPVDLALGPNGHLFVLDRGRGAIQIFSLDGTYARDIPLGDALRDPAALTVAKDGSILVTDGRTRHQIYAFPPFDEIPWLAPAPRGIAGRVQFRGADFEDPLAVAVNDVGTVIVLDNAAGRLFRRNLSTPDEQLGTDDLLYGGTGTGRGSFREPVDIVFADRDELLILDRELRKIERIRLTTEASLSSLPEHRYPIRVTRVGTGLPTPLLDIGYGPDGSPRFLLQVGDRSATILGTRADIVETVYGDRVRIFQPDPEQMRVGIAGDIGKIAEGVLTDSLVVIADPDRDRFSVYAIADGRLLGRFGDNYRDNRRLKDPLGVGVLSDGRIVIGDTGNDRLKIFSADLASLVAAYHVPKPGGVAVSPTGGIFVWSEDGARVGRLNVEEGGIELLDPELLPRSVVDLTFDQAGNLFALDGETHRVTILDSTLSRVLAQLGAEDGLDRPERVRVDLDGNIYIADGGLERTVIFRWDVRVPGLTGLDIDYDGQIAELSWDRSNSVFVRAYEIQGSDEMNGPFAPLAVTDSSFYRLDASTLTDPPRYVRVAPVMITGVRGSPTVTQPLSLFTAAAAYERGDYEDAIRYAREGVRAVESGLLERDERLKGKLLRIGFFSAYRRGDFESALNWAREAAAIPMPSDELIEFLFTLAQVYLQLDDPQKASQQILALVAQDPRAEYYRDEAVVDQSFRIYRRLRDAGQPEDALEYLRMYSRSIPSLAPELRRQYADSITVYSTRARLAPGFRYWRNASYGQVVTFLEGLLRQGGLSEEQLVVSSQLLAAAHFAFGNRAKAEDVFREIFEVRPGFDLEREIPRLQALYDLTIYNPQMRQYFGGLRGRP